MLSICRCFSSSKIWFCFEAKLLMSSLLVIVDKWLTFKLQICLHLWDISRRFRKCNIFVFLSFEFWREKYENFNVLNICLHYRLSSEKSAGKFKSLFCFVNTDQYVITRGERREISFPFLYFYPQDNSMLSRTISCEHHQWMLGHLGCFLLPNRKEEKRRRQVLQQLPVVFCDLGQLSSLTFLPSSKTHNYIEIMVSSSFLRRAQKLVKVCLHSS